MNLARKPTVALLVAILVVLAVSAFSQLREEVDTFGGSINMTHRGLVLVVVALVALGGAITIALWPRDTARPTTASDLPPPPTDDLFQLAREINRQVVEENEAQVAAIEQIRQKERLTMVEHLAAGIAHELGTPLSVTSARAELIATTDLPRAEVVHSARVIVEQADRMAAIIRQLLDFSRRGAGRRVDVDLRQVVATTVDLIAGIANKAKVEVVSDAGREQVPVFVDPSTIQHALTNIALNGIQAMPSGGQLRIRIESRRLQPPSEVSDAAGTYQCVVIEDDGGGIPPEHLPQLFEPLFTTKRVGEGTGLGLPIAHGIVAEHGGWIAVESVEGRGSRFSVMLPRPSAGAARREVAA